MPASLLASYPRPASAAGQLTSTDLGSWNTSTRVLASLLSDGLVAATPAPASINGEAYLLIHGKQATPSTPAVWIGLSRAGQQRLADGGAALPAVFPGDFAPPVATTTYGDKGENGVTTYTPAALLSHLRPIIDNPTPIDDGCFKTICSELGNSAANGANWIDWYRTQKVLGLRSSMLEWEQALYTGHPTHPVSGGQRADYTTWAEIVLCRCTVRFQRAIPSPTSHPSASRRS